MTTLLQVQTGESHVKQYNAVYLRYLQLAWGTDMKVDLGLRTIKQTGMSLEKCHI